MVMRNYKLLNPKFQNRIYIIMDVLLSFLIGVRIWFRHGNNIKDFF